MFKLVLRIKVGLKITLELGIHLRRTEGKEQK